MRTELSTEKLEKIDAKYGLFESHISSASVPKNFPVNPDTKFEPDSSLYGGQDGMEIYKCLMEQLKILKPRAIFLECFDFQKAILVTHMPGYNLKHTQKMTGQARMLFFENW